jgi:hypothetical protein
MTLDAGRVGPGSPQDEGKESDRLDELTLLLLCVESGRCVLLTVVLALRMLVADGGGWSRCSGRARGGIRRFLWSCAGGVRGLAGMGRR